MNEYSSYSCHKNLATAVYKSKIPNLHRNYAGWLYLRKLEEYGGAFNIKIAIGIFQDVFKITYHQARNLILHGQHIFWEIHHDQVRIIGKKRVFEYFGVQDNPGKIFLVPHEELFTKRLQHLRSTLWQISIAGSMRARSSMERELHRTCQTFRNYQKYAKKKPIKNFTEEEYIDPITGEMYHKQLSNFYLEPFCSKTRHYGKKYDWNDTVGLDPKEVPVAVYHPRIYFNTDNQYQDYERKGYVDKSESAYVFSQRKVFNRKNGGVNLWKTVC